MVVSCIDRSWESRLDPLEEQPVVVLKSEPSPILLRHPSSYKAPNTFLT